jgi:3-mercaptopyruvate sulfurtransferase SseA
MKTIILLLAAAFAACNSAHSGANIERQVATTPTPSPAAAVAQNPLDNVRRVTTAELADLIKQGKVLVVDVRNKEAYDRGHIKGAKLLPINEVGERGKELPRDKMIVTYCS